MVYTTNEYKVLLNQYIWKAEKEHTASTVKAEGKVAKILRYVESLEPFKMPNKNKFKMTHMPIFDGQVKKPVDAIAKDWKTSGGQSEMISLILKLLSKVEYLMDVLPEWKSLPLTQAITS
eukprot:15344646-Ditylum_brightwellii.AAC.1